MQQPGDHLDHPRLDDVITWNFVRVARLVGHRLATRLAGHQLNPIQFGALAFLSERPEMSTADIARAVFVRPQSMTPLLDDLEDRDLIRRTGPRGRGRRNPLQITDAGRATLDAAWRIAADSNDLSDAGLEPEESRQLNRLLLKVVRSTTGAAAAAESDDFDVSQDASQVD